MSCGVAAVVIAGIGAAAAAGSTAYGIVNGQNQSAMQQEALKRQNTAQQTATAQALSNERKSEVAQGAANQQQADITGIMKRAAAGGNGLSSTMLTGPGGVDTSGLNLGGSSLLGK